MKRFFDIVLSFIGLIITSPIILIIMLVVSCTSRGGPFFFGTRVGKNGKNFTIIKFRSMKINSEEHGAWNISGKDPRLTKVGLFLRKTKLDEIPQLFNIFFGQMSFVGPRPELQYYVDMYTEQEKAILDNKPGMTDWASIVNAEQIVEFTNASDPNKVYLEYIRPLKLKLQLYYRYNNNIWSDFVCIIWTGWKVITHTKRIPNCVKDIVEQYRKEHEKK
jgi:lipopolysaccharide/colanic/teichoic acid biosynthesis glycosyltransferase